MATELRERGLYRLDDQEFVAAEGHEGGWVLYAPEEWDTFSTADYEVRPDGVITFQGRPTSWTAADLVDTGQDVDG